MASEATLKVWIDKLLLGRAEAAEQQLTTERARHASMAAEFELIAAGKHPRYWTLEKGDVLLRQTGERRTPKLGEWIKPDDGSYQLVGVADFYDEQPIYRRIDAPSGEPVQPSPAPVEEPEPAKYQANGGRLYYCGELLAQFYAHVGGHVQSDLQASSKCAAYLNGSSPEHATIREQAAEIERLKAELKSLKFQHDSLDEIMEELRAKLNPAVGRHSSSLAGCVHDAVSQLASLRSQLQQANEQVERGGRAITKPTLGSVIHDLRDGNNKQLADFLEAGMAEVRIIPAAPAEASEGSKTYPGNPPDDSGDWEFSQTQGMWFKRRNAIPAPAPAAKSEKWRVNNFRVHPANGERDEFAIVLAEAEPPTKEQSKDAADWLNRRAEIESQLAQLAKYKRDAEAWGKPNRDAEAVAAMRSKNISVVRLFHNATWEARHDVAGFPYTKSQPFSDPADAVLSLAAQLASQADQQHGKEQA